MRILIWLGLICCLNAASLAQKVTVQITSPYSGGSPAVYDRYGENVYNAYVKLVASEYRNENGNYFYWLEAEITFPALGYYSLAIDGNYSSISALDSQGYNGGHVYIDPNITVPPTFFPGVTVMDGDRAITGQLDVDSGTLNLGVHPLDISVPAFSITGVAGLIEDYGPDYVAGLHLNRARTTEATWAWQVGNNWLMTLSGSGLMVKGSRVLTESSLDTLPLQRLAIGTGSSAAAGSFASGAFNFASGKWSVAMGYGTIASSFSQSVFGRYNSNASTYNPNMWVPTDDLFVVGNGDGSASHLRSNALTIRKDGATAIGRGVKAHYDGQVVVGRYNRTDVSDSSTTPATDHTKGAFVIGAGSLVNGQPVQKNALRVLDSGAVLVNPGGDISMGAFQAGERP